MNWCSKSRAGIWQFKNVGMTGVGSLPKNCSTFEAYMCAVWHVFGVCQVKFQLPPHSEKGGNLKWGQDILAGVCSLVHFS